MGRQMRTMDRDAALQGVGSDVRAPDGKDGVT